MSLLSDIATLIIVYGLLTPLFDKVTRLVSSDYGAHSNEHALRHIWHGECLTANNYSSVIMHHINTINKPSSLQAKTALGNKKYKYRETSNRCVQVRTWTPFTVKIASSASMSIRHPTMSPGRHPSTSGTGVGLAPCHIKRRQPSYDKEYMSSPIPYPSCIRNQLFY